MREFALSFEGVKPLARQSFKDECDVNKIMRNFEKTAMLSHVNEHQGRYGDFTEAPQDFQAALDQVGAAREMFLTIPAKIRKKFDNDPGQFVDFVANATEDELREYGLLPPMQTASEPPSGGQPGVEPATAPEEAEE